jgi:hypothetical protein
MSKSGLDEHDREVSIAAAEAFDRAKRERDELIQRVMEATAGLEAKNVTISQLELALAEERNRGATYRNERDQAIQERADLCALFANVYNQLERFELPIPIKRNGNGNGGGRRSRLAVVDGNGNGDALPDASASPKNVANSSPLLAHV